MTPVQILEQHFLQRCEAVRESAARSYPEYTFNVWSSSIGGRTSLQGHNLGVEAVFPDASRSQASTVAIVIGLRHLTTSPEIDDASVGWGAGDAPDISVDLMTESLPFNAANISRIEEEFPRLLSTFLGAVAAYSLHGAA